MRRRCKCGTRAVSFREAIHGDRLRLCCRSCGRRIAIARSLRLRMWIMGWDK